MNTVKLTKFLVSTSIAIAIPAMAGVPLTPIATAYLAFTSKNFISTMLTRLYLKSFSDEDIERFLSIKKSHTKGPDISNSDNEFYDSVYGNLEFIYLLTVITFSLSPVCRSIFNSSFDIRDGICRSFAADNAAASPAFNIIGDILLEKISSLYPMYKFSNLSIHNIFAVFATSLYVRSFDSSTHNLAILLADIIIDNKLPSKEQSLNDIIDNNITMPFITAVASCAFSSLGLYPIIAKIPFVDKIMSEELLAGMSR